jgi:hypothetical protein
VHGALTDAHIWRLVALSGRVEDVRKLGDRWRAEVIVGSQRILVVGQPGAGIPAASVVEGRAIRLVGIVRRAFPSASDRRPSLLPRSPADVEAGSAGAASSGSGSGSGGSGSSGGSAGSGGSVGSAPAGGFGGPGAGGAPGSAVVPDADLADLAASAGLVVRVGGLVTELTADGFRLDDGTAIGRVVLAGPAADQRPLIEPGDAINVTGRVARLDDGSFGVVVDDAAAIGLGSDPLAGAVPVGGSTGGTTDGSPVADPGGTGTLAAGFADGLVGVPGAGPGLASLLAISMLSLVVTAIRRRHTRRLLASRVAVRLATFAGSPVPSEPSPAALPPVDSGPERGASVGHAR